MTPYIIMVWVLFHFNDLKINYIVKAKYCFVAILIFACIRYDVGYDYHTYVQLVLRDADQYVLENVEPLSKIFMDIGFYSHYQVYFILSSIITLYPLYKIFTKYSINPAYSFLIYFLFPQFYLESQSIVRNAVAFSIVFYASMLLLEKSYAKSLLCVIVAFLFHKSALIGLMIYPLYWIGFNRKLHIAAYVVSFFITVVVMRYVGAYADQIQLLSAIEGYAEDGRSEGGTMKLILNGIAILNLFYWDRIAKLNKNNGYFLSLFNLGVCLWNVFLSVDSTIALRFSSYFILSILLLVPQYKYLAPERKKLKVSRCVTSFFLLLFISYFTLCIKAYLQKPDRMSNVPYRTIFYHSNYKNYPLYD